MSIHLTKTITDALPQLLGFVGGFLSSSVVALLLTRSFERTDKKRDVIALAFKMALSWQGMLYKVRRRSGGVEEERKLIEEFHNLQEGINYYQGLISAESLFLGRSYKKFVLAVKKQNKILIQEAWESPIRRPKEGLPKGIKTPDADAISETFLRDVRNWFSFWCFRKFFVIVRNWHE